jgi:hypothetical protein
MKRKLITLLLNLILICSVKAQVWYPEGVYIGAEPSKVTVDNQVITIARSGFDIANSFWQVSVYNGVSWQRLPI